MRRLNTTNDIPVTACLLACFAASALGCGGSSQPTGPDFPRVAMVIDDGFDPSLPVFAGKVIGTYTVTCTPAATGGGENSDGGTDGGLPPGLDQDKAALLAELAQPDDSCQLTSGLTAVANPLADLEGERARWNAAMRGDVLPDASLEALEDEIPNRLMNARFHGTATSGVVATSDPRVKLVLVQIALDSEEEAGASIGCLAQDAIDAATALLADPDVSAAYLQRPPASVDRQLAEARAQLGVQLVNESFGHLARFAVEDLLYRSGCPAVSLASYFQTLGDLDQAYTLAHVEPGVLVVQSAGNDGARVDSPQDSLDCSPGDPRHLLVGAYGFGGAHSSFTNFGDCVELYAPGETVVTPLPGDWLYPLSGTSFSAPLVVGLSTAKAPSPFTPASARAALDALREPNGNIRPRNFPAPLLYDPAHDPYVSALLAATASARVRPPQRFSAAALNKALWPIRWVSERARRGAR
ncbi:MAG TPA: S8 family serine peptidase [Polyangia bacterium]|jgi:hypothetical protein